MEQSAPTPKRMRKVFAILSGVLLLLYSCGKAAQEAEINVSTVSVSPSTATLNIGESTQLKVTVSPSNATDKTVVWSSADPAIATVSNTGLVTAVAEGAVNIVAKAGGKTGACRITVNKSIVPVLSISLNKTELALVKGQSETLIATVSPSDATDKSITWSSSDNNIAEVDQSGKVTAKKGGNATITAKAGEHTANCVVVITVPVESVSLDRISVSLEVEQSTTLVATVKPDDATDKAVTWTTSNASIATVENGKVTAIKEGEATITAAAGGKSATCKVVVAKKVIAVSSVELNKTTLELVEEDSETLVATVKPDDATDKTVTWSTSDASVATVEGGKVTAIMTGTAFITASAGEKSVECKVSVYKKDCAPLPGVFSVSSTKKVKFSRGNLQATYDGSAWSWAFATNQYDYIGPRAANNLINGNGTVSANGTVDLFGWSTDATYLGINNSTSSSDYSGNFVDWGSNANVQAGIGADWRTLSSNEWRYLFHGRTTVATRYCKASVNYKYGMVIFPDSYSHPAGVAAVANANNSSVDFESNYWEGDDWLQMELAGAVFLPAVGYRVGTSVEHYGTTIDPNGYYWSSTSSSIDGAKCCGFSESNVGCELNGTRSTGRSVRLVHNQ